jgi:hypothetical protein
MKLNRKDKYFLLGILFIFQFVCMNYGQKISPICIFQVDLLMNLFDADARPLLIPVAFIYFGELLILFSFLQRQLAFFNLLSLIGLGAMGTTVLLLGIITSKPLLVFGSALPFIIFSILFVIRMWRKADLEKYIVNDKES